MYRDEADQQIQEMLANGIITPSVSPWSSPIVLVRKKNGDLRFCVDYRKLNQITVNDSHPLPLISDLLDSVKDAKYFSLLDLRSGYWQIPVAQEDRAKTAFVTQNGLYEFTRMPFGLKTASATFQRAMEVILAGLTFEICLCYLDDVIVFGKTLTEHNDRLKTVLTRFRDNNLRVKLAKCVFASPQVTYLGHCISQQGVSPDPTKLTAVAKISLPSNIKEVRTFLGLTGYYRRFIPNYATVAQPLTKLTSKEYCNNFVWTDECTAAFDKLKQLLCSAPILCYPDFDREFILQTDASDVGLGAVLSQIDKSGNEHVVAYASKTLSPREKNYSTTEKEAFAIQFGTQHFRVYLLGRKFTISTDHSALSWLHSMEPKGRIARWLMDLQEFDFEVKHRAGRVHNNADALSRLRPTPELIRKLQQDAINTCSVTLNPSINIRDAQQQDASIAKLRDLKLRNQPKPSVSKSQDVYFRKMLRHYDKLFIRDGILVRAIGQRKSYPNYVIVLPQSLITTCVKAMHDSPFAGHMGVARTEERIRQRFYCKVFSCFSPPTVLHSDQGANFESNLMHELCDLMGIAKTRTSAYHPQCDGQVERQNRTLQDMLSKFVSNHADDWDQWLDPVVFAYNTSRHDSTGYSPHEMIFGRTPRMPFELEIGMPLSSPAQNTEYIHSTRRTLQDIHNIARSNLADNRARQDKCNAKSTSWKPYLAGQAVWLKRPKQWKFGPTWVGPYQVLERLGVNYRIKRQDGKVSIVHHDNLKLSRIPSGNGQIVPPTPESGDLEVVEPLFEAQNVGCEGTHGANSVPRVRPARVRQNVQPPKRYGVD